MVRLSIVASLLFLGACSSSTDTSSKDAGPTTWQGPINPGFEAEGPDDFQPDYWAIEGKTVGQCPSYSGIDPYPMRRETGAEFMPSDGVHYLLVEPGPSAMQLTATQDGVSLDQATTLRFDYELSGTLGPEPTASDVTIEILFTSEGTATLWKKELVHEPGASIPIPEEKKLDETVTFEPFAKPGRFTIRVTESCDAIPQEGIRSSTTFRFAIDHIRAD